MNDFKPIPQSEMDAIRSLKRAWYRNWGKSGKKKRALLLGHKTIYLLVSYQALLTEYEKQRECLREAKVQHRICRVYCVGLGDECDCGASEHNARIDAVRGREGHGVR